MKKHVILGVLGLAVTSVFTSCSKGSDLYDAGTVQQNQQEQKIAQLKQTYSDAFTKEFGTIASNNAWGFERTTGSVSRTRTASVSETDLWIIPENLWGGSANKEGWNANDAEAAIAAKKGYVLDGFDFNNYFIQHVEQPKNDKNNKKQSLSLQAWSSKDKEWQYVTNFTKGKNNDDFVTVEKTYFFSNVYSAAQGTTLMKDMGGEPYYNEKNANDPANGKLFRLEIDGSEYSYNYTIEIQRTYHKKPYKKYFTEPLLGFKMDNGSYWVMRLAEAENTSNNVMAEGRIFCEDMGANDFDYNDVVFDAQIMGNGVIKINVLAHGGELDITIDDVKVTLPAMTNTGLADADPQEITIPALANGKPKYKTINDIPVKVVPNGDAKNAYDLTAIKGSAPQKVCVPVGTLWADEYVCINKAYTPFTSYVNVSNPADWTFELNPIFVDLDLGNNK